MLVAIPLFQRYTALDAIGPYDVLQRVPSIDVVFVGHHRGEVRADNGMLGITVDASYDDISNPDVVVVPGGIGSRALLDRSAIVDWIAAVDAGTRFTTSVCTGSLLLGAAGLLKDLTATTHWRAVEVLESLGASYVPERVVEHLDRRIITAAGVSSGIDMALRLVELLVDADAAKAAQLMIEYDPQPPFDAGSVAKADDAVRARAAEYYQLRS